MNVFELEFFCFYVNFSFYKHFIDSLYQSSVKSLEDSRKRWILEMEDSCNVSTLIPLRPLFSAPFIFALLIFIPKEGRVKK